MSRKKESIIAIAIILLLVIVLFSLWRRSDNSAVTNDTSANLETGEEREVDIPAVDPADIPENSEVTANTVARIFVERFGSYSTESEYQNVEDVMAVATASLSRRLADILEDAKDEGSADYYGVSTRIISIKTEVANDHEARFLVTTQREESFDSPANTSVRYQDIRVSLVKEGDSWLVNDFSWL